MSDIPILHEKEKPEQVQDTMTSLQSQIDFFSSSSSKKDRINNTIGNKKENDYQVETQKTLGEMASYLKPKRLQPKRNVMIKQSPESVYLADTITGSLKEERESGKGFFGNLLERLGGLFGLGVAGVGGIIARLFPRLAKLLPMAAIAGSIIWAIVDGIMATGEAENWGVGKISAFIGGFLGGTGSGWDNAKKNAGKWGLAGMGAGFLAAGPLGAIVGALLGAAIGGLLGYIGGEKIAVNVDKVLNWFKDNVATVAPIAGTILGGALLGLALGPVGLVAGGILGLAAGAVLGGLMEGVPFDEIWQYVSRSPGLLAGLGAITGATIGLVTFGPLGMIVGALLGAAVGAIIGNIRSDKAKVGRNLAKEYGEQEEVAQTALTNIRRQRALEAARKGLTGEEQEAYVKRPITEEEQEQYPELLERAGVEQKGTSISMEGLILDTGRTMEEERKHRVSQLEEGPGGGHYMSPSVTPVQWRSTGKTIDFLNPVTGKWETYLIREDPNQGKIDKLLKKIKDTPIDISYDAVGGSLYQWGEGKYYHNPEYSENKPYSQYSVFSRLITALGSEAYFHTGGISNKEQLAILRKDEEVLSPKQSAHYTQILDRADMPEIDNSSEELLSELKSFKKIVENKKTNAGNVIQNNFASKYSPDSVMRQLRVSEVL